MDGRANGQVALYLPDVEIHECPTLSEASASMKHYAPDACLLAGGTDLLVDLKTGRSTYSHLISINHLADLREVGDTGEGLRIGAMTTLTQLDRSPLVRERFRPLRDATRKMASPPIRNVATVGGNIASAVPCADLPPILMAMNADVRLWLDEQERSVSLDSFLLGSRRTALRDGEILTAVQVPSLRPRFGAAYERFGLRDGNAIAVAAVAASILVGEDGVVADARLVLGAVSPVPKLVPAARDVLVGSPPDTARFNKAARLAREAASPISDVRGSAEFRCELVQVLAQRALEKAVRRAEEHGE